MQMNFKKMAAVLLSSSMVLSSASGFNPTTALAASDKKPTISGVADGKTYTAKSKSVTIKDDKKLKSVTLDGKSCSIKSNKKTSTFTVSGYKQHTIVVKDSGGNSVTVKFTLKNAASTSNTSKNNTTSAKKDTAKPTISGVSNGKTYIAESKSITVKDNTKLASVTLDGKKCSVSRKTSTFTVKGYTAHTIIATDDAGNTTKTTFTLEPKVSKVTTFNGIEPVMTQNVGDTVNFSCKNESGICGVVLVTGSNKPLVLYTNLSQPATSELSLSFQVTTDMVLEGASIYVAYKDKTSSVIPAVGKLFFGSMSQVGVSKSQVMKFKGGDTEKPTISYEGNTVESKYKIEDYMDITPKGMVVVSDDSILKEVSVNGQTIQKYTDSSNQCEIDLSNYGVNGGNGTSNSYVIAATDIYGNKETGTISFSKKNDNSKPVINCDVTIVTDVDETLSFSVTDDGCGLDNIIMTASDPYVNYSNVILENGGGLDSYTCEIPVTADMLSAQKFTITVTDLAGNIQTKNIKISSSDVKAPIYSVNGTEVSRDYSVTRTGETDNYDIIVRDDSQLKEVILYEQNGSDWSVVTDFLGNSYGNFPKDVSFTLNSFIAEGMTSHVYKVKATDVVGNSASYNIKISKQADSITINGKDIVDKKKPVINSSGELKGDLGEDVSISVTDNEDGSGLKSILISSGNDVRTLFETSEECTSFGENVSVTIDQELVLNKTYSVIATDFAGNTVEKKVKFTLNDKEKPGLTFNDAALSGTTFVMEIDPDDKTPLPFTVTDNSALKSIKVNDVEVLNGITEGEYTSDIPRVKGTHTIKATDLAGNVATYKITLKEETDKKKPVINDIDSKMEVDIDDSITANVTDEGFGIRSITIYPDGYEMGGETLFSTTSKKSTFSEIVTIECSPEVIAKKKYVLKVEDFAGNITTKKFSIILDEKEKPTLAYNGTVLEKTSATLIIDKTEVNSLGFSLTDNSEYLQSIKIDGKEELSNIENGAHEFTLPTNDATHKIIATDLAGNKATYNIKVKEETDKKKPVVTGITSTVKADLNEEVSFDVTDEGFGIKTVSLVNKANVTDSTMLFEAEGRKKSFEEKVSFVCTPEMIYTRNYYIQVVDYAGNIQKKAFALKLKDSSAPVIKMEDDELEKNVTLTASTGKLEFEVSDDSGYLRSVVVDGKEYVSGKWTDEEVSFSIDKKAGTHTIKVTDLAGNKVTRKVKIK